MTIAVDLGRKATKQTNKNSKKELNEPNIWLFYTIIWKFSPVLLKATQNFPILWVGPCSQNAEKKHWLWVKRCLIVVQGFKGCKVLEVLTTDFQCVELCSHWSFWVASSSYDFFIPDRIDILSFILQTQKDWLVESLLTRLCRQTWKPGLLRLLMMVGNPNCRSSTKVKRRCFSQKRYRLWSLLRWRRQRRLILERYSICNNFLLVKVLSMSWSWCRVIFIKICSVVLDNQHLEVPCIY